MGIVLYKQQTNFRRDKVFFSTYYILTRLVYFLQLFDSKKIAPFSKIAGSLAECQKSCVHLGSM